MSENSKLLSYQLLMYRHRSKVNYCNLNSLGNQENSKSENKIKQARKLQATLVRNYYRPSH